MLGITGIANKEQMRRHLDRVDRIFKQDRYIADRTRQAESGLNTPEIVLGDDKDKPFTNFSWDFSPGWKDRAYKRLRELRNSGKPHMPLSFKHHADGQVEKIYESEVDLEPFENGDACVNCHEWQPEDRDRRRELHQRLQSVTGMRPRDGVSLDDCCCYCGNRLDLQKRYVA